MPVLKGGSCSINTRRPSMPSGFAKSKSRNSKSRNGELSVLSNRHPIHLGPQVPLQSFVNQLTASLGAIGAKLRSPEDRVALSFQDYCRYLQFAASRTGGIQCR